MPTIVGISVSMGRKIFMLSWAELEFFSEPRGLISFERILHVYDYSNSSLRYISGKTNDFEGMFNKETD